MEPVQDQDLAGTTVSHYTIVSMIAAGGQGSVYCGRDQRLYREVAIKVLNPERLRDPVARRRLKAEAQVLSRLNDPHVAGVFDFVTEHGRDFMVMEYVPGATLRQVLAGGPLPAAEVLRLGAQLARGLAAAHDAYVVHCDVKPGNIKITTSGELKILDFGLARLMPAAVVLDNASRTESDGTVAGTVPYMSPEGLRGETTDRRIDIFSAGVVLYEMATGFPAFPQRNLARLIEAIQHVEPRAPSAINPNVPLALENVIVKAMQKDADRRYQHAREMAESLDALAPGGRPTGAARTVASIAC